MVDQVSVARCVVYFSSIAIQAFFLDRTLPKKSGETGHWIIMSAFAILRMIVFIAGIPFRALFEIACGMAVASALYKGGNLSRLVSASIPVFLDGIIDALTFSIYYYAISDLTAGQYAVGMERAFIFLIANIVMGGLFYLITRGVEKDRDATWRDMPYLFVIPCGCYVMLSIHYGVLERNPSSEASFLFLCETAFLLALNIGSVALYNQTVTRERTLARVKAMKRTMELTSSHVSELTQIESELIALRHNVKIHYDAISGLIKAGDYKKAESYIAAATANAAGGSAYVSNPALNAVISSNARKAEKMHIGFQALLTLPEESNLTDVEYCAIIGNILSNAIEGNTNISNAVGKKTGEDSGKYIHLTAYMSNAQQIICCRNSTDNTGSFSTTDSLPSSKSDGGIHGVGTKHIKRVIEAKGGFVVYRLAKGEFTTFVTISLPRRPDKS